jgi:hypothetical protein
MDNVVYARLLTSDDLVDSLGERISPVMPSDNDPLPFLFYWRLDTGDTLTLSGSVRPRPYTFAFDVWATTQAEARAIQDAVYDVMNNWREGEVRGSFRQTEAAQPDEVGYHIQSTYQIWY